MGIYHTAYAFWGWQIEVPDLEPNEDGEIDTYEWLENLCEGIEGLGHHILGSHDGWDEDSCPKALCVGSSASTEFYKTVDILEKAQRPDPSTVERIRGELKAKGFIVNTPVKLLLGGSSG